MNARWNNLALLLLRVALGLVFVMHGWQKFFVYGHAGVTGMLGQLGVPFPSISAVLISTTELVGGLALLAGFGTRIAASLLAFAMAVAVITAHLPHGFFAPAGFEYPLTLLIISVAIAVVGAGAYSLDAKLFDRRHAGALDWKNAA